MRLPVTTHTDRPWRIHELTPDFAVEDVWALPTPGGPGELPRLLSAVTIGQFSEGAPFVARTLWAARWKLGALLGWDGPDHGLGARVSSLKDRLPSDLTGAPAAADGDLFNPLYQLPDEWAAELANRTVHTVMHLGWVPDGSGGYRGEMTVLVRPNGRAGAAYMALIKPFRYLWVYPALLRFIGSRWRDGGTP